MVKTIGKIILIGFVLAGGLYALILSGYGGAITTINNDFIAFLPLDLRFVIYTIIFALLIGVIYTFIN